MTEHGFAADDRRPSFSIDQAARETGLTDAQVRYYADTYRDFLGLKRDAHGRWELSAAHLRFMAVLAHGGTPARATAALRGAVWLHGDAMAPARSAAGVVPPSSSAGHSRHPERAPGDGPTLEPARDQNHAHEPDLAARLDDMALYVADLAEETKQIQMLLSRIISLLDGSARPLPETVRPWEPPALGPDLCAGKGAGESSPT